MAREASAAQREKQEQSIKARKSELFLEEEVVESGPRKRLRDYVKETPAAPLSKNVKLMLWGSAAPVVLLFVVALLARKSHFKEPEEFVPVHPTTPVASRGGDKLPVVGATKSEGPGPGATADSSKPPQEKAKAKPKRKPKAKPKPKDETAVAQNTEGDSATSDKPKDGDQGDQASGEKLKNKGTAKGKTDAKGKPATPEKPRKQAAPILKKKPKVYNPAYPPRTPSGEKKADSDSDSDLGIP
jgi:hypothetical protein